MTEPTSLPTWVEGARGSLHDVDNLPYAVVRHPSWEDERGRVGVRIGDLVLDLAPVAAAEMLEVAHVFEGALAQPPARARPCPLERHPAVDRLPPDRRG